MIQLRSHGISRFCSYSKNLRFARFSSIVRSRNGCVERIQESARNVLFLSQFIFGLESRNPSLRCYRMHLIVANLAWILKNSELFPTLEKPYVDPMRQWPMESRRILLLSIGRWKLAIKSIYGKVENRKRKYPDLVLTDKSIHTHFCVHSTVVLCSSGSGRCIQRKEFVLCKSSKMLLLVFDAFQIPWTEKCI